MGSYLRLMKALRTAARQLQSGWGQSGPWLASLPPPQPVCVLLQPVFRARPRAQR
ncbi:MAG: hypothetical protein WC617_11710 [Rhodanobacter sp.]